MLTTEEKKALRYVAEVWGTTESEVLRTMRPEEVLEERDRIREVAGEAA